MHYRKLGKTGILVSQIGFGAWGIGGPTKGATSYGKTDDRVSKRALQKAFDCGINFFDTADIYGSGHSETLIGEVFAKLRDKIIIASKVGFYEHNSKQDFSPVYIKKALRNTLKRLGTDYVDLYQLHSPDISGLKDETVDTLKCLQKEGKIRNFGISLRSPGDGLIAVEKFGFGVIQVNFNLVDQRALDNGLFDFCTEQKIGIICRTPLCFGFLSGNYAADAKFASSDHRSNWPAEQIAKWANAYRIFSKVIQEQVKQTNAQIALRFCLSYPQVSTVIPGMMTEQEVIENIGASELGVFNEKLKVKFESIYHKTKFFVTEKSSNVK